MSDRGELERQVAITKCQIMAHEQKVHKLKVLLRQLESKLKHLSYAVPFSSPNDPEEPKP